MRQLLELRYAMEKLRPLDAKLQYQVERLLKVYRHDTFCTVLVLVCGTTLVAHNGGTRCAGIQLAEKGVTDNDLSRPNPDALVPKNGIEDSEEEHDDIPTNGDVGVYKAPKIAAIMYDEEGGVAGKRERRLAKKKEALKRRCDSPICFLVLLLHRQAQVLTALSFPRY